DVTIGGDPVEKKVSATSAAARNVKRPQTRQYLVSRFRSGNRAARDEFSDRIRQCVAIGFGLARSEIVGSPPQDVCEIDLGRRAQRNPPARVSHRPYQRGRTLSERRRK